MIQKGIHIEIRRKSNLINEKEWTIDTSSSICKEYDYMPINFWDRLSRSINSNYSAFKQLLTHLNRALTSLCCKYYNIVASASIKESFTVGQPTLSRWLTAFIISSSINPNLIGTCHTELSNIGKYGDYMVDIIRKLLEHYKRSKMLVFVT